MRHAPGILALAAALAVSAAGCGGTLPPARALVPGSPAICVLPIEDLSGQAGVGERLTRVVYTELVRSGRWQVQEPGETDLALVEARVRTTAVMTRDQTIDISQRLGVRWMLTGSVLEYGRVRGAEGDLPAVGLALRLLDGRDGRVVWADQEFRSGEDRETVFAWGRITDVTRLAASTAADLVQNIRLPAAGDTSSVKKGAP